MFIYDLESLETEDNTEETVECEELEKAFESSFTYHAIPLNEQMTLDDNGIPFTLQELMDLKELREELAEDN